MAEKLTINEGKDNVKYSFINPIIKKILKYNYNLKE